jgi:hypothetical protein
VTVDQVSNCPELTPRDTQADIIQNEFSLSSTVSQPTPPSILSPNASVSIDKGSP